ncbi:MAG: NADH-quinone oxidoreductase subunit B family protein [Candidatus Hodarchaeales archaeon]
MKVASEWFAVCGGCEVTILDIGDGIVDLLSKLELVHWPVLLDHKYYGQTGERKEIEIPKADVGIITGGVRTEQEREIAKMMRDSCTTLIADGTCACYGGVPAMANMFTVQEIAEYVAKTPTTDSYDKEHPAVVGGEIPKLTDRIYALDEVVDVDIKIPGCPSTPEMVGEALTALLEGKSFELPEKSVCDKCPKVREKKAIASLQRTLGPMPEDGGRCYLELGYLCMGPATLSGCGESEETPRCIRANMTCEGCFGPVREGANVMVDMMGALSSIGIDTSQILDRKGTFNRFTGAHNKLRPVRR